MRVRKARRTVWQIAAAFKELGPADSVHALGIRDYAKRFEKFLQWLVPFGGLISEVDFFNARVLKERVDGMVFQSAREGATTHHPM